MAVERETFENLVPLQFISFNFPNPLFTTNPKSLNQYGQSLRIAILDSPQQPATDPPQLAAMLVPHNREHDWIFSTKNGNLQLLLNSPGISRLILIGNPLHDADDFPAIYNRPMNEDSTDILHIQERLTPLLFALSPKSAFINNLPPEIPFVTYEDNVICSVSVEKCTGSYVGEMLVEDVEIETFGSNSKGREFRRRLRFKRMPNLVQTEIRIISEIPVEDFGVKAVKFRPDNSCLVHPYLPPMVASLSLISTHLDRGDCLDSKPRVLCIGVGGGALLSFLHTHFAFRVYGVEIDEIVRKVAKKYFGLVENEMLRVCVGDGIEIIKKVAENIAFVSNGYRKSNGNVDSFRDLHSPFDVIMVDLDASDARNGLCAPPMEFIRKEVLSAAKLALQTHGILVINVIPVSRTFYDYLINEFREVFAELYEINVENEENYVLIAAVTPVMIVSSDNDNPIVKKLNLIIPKQYIDCIRKL
ncbi:hypothetical protein ACHQM5_020266 [Ranunculus cassubicifolius]